MAQQIDKLDENEINELFCYLSEETQDALYLEYETAHAEFLVANYFTHSEVVETFNRKEAQRVSKGVQGLVDYWVGDIHLKSTNITSRYTNNTLEIKLLLVIDDGSEAEYEHGFITQSVRSKWDVYKQQLELLGWYDALGLKVKL